jgi:phenylpropionate dioxygenase-like ring-hydroxylating dioxygenase large terminal subunit
MLTYEENELITHVGPGTPMGGVLRQYWMPAMMSAELPSPDCTPVRLRLLCENLIAFRATSGKVGIIADACPHRGASLFFGRNEEDGLRCVYHGWKFDIEGSCVDMPSEPPESNFKTKVHARAYATQERGGMIWVYMGPREVPPPLPNLESNMQPEGEGSIGAFFSECNWLQSLEGDYDTVHLGFLHQGSIQPEEVPDKSLEYYVLKTRWARFITADTEFGCTYGCYRPAEEDTTYWRIAQFLFPFWAMIPTVPLGTRKMVIGVVPVDDQHCMRWTFGENLRGGINNPLVDGITTGYHTDPSHNGTGWLDRFRPAGNSRNDYLIDREAQRLNVGGMGYSGIPGRGQDGAVTESMGTIYQRNQEHLGVTDSGIIRMRRLFIKAARQFRDEGILPPAVDQPDLYRVRSGAVVLPNGVNGIEATQDLQWKALEEEPPSIEVGR